MSEREVLGLALPCSACMLAALAFVRAKTPRRRLWVMMGLVRG